MDRTQAQPEETPRPGPAPAPGTGAPPTDGTPPAGTAVAPAAGAGVAAAAGPVRVVTLVAGEFTVTVNPVDGSEIEPHRPGAGPDPGRRPAKRDAAARAARDAAARPPGLPVPGRPLLERAEEKERLVRLLQRGRSVRLTGPAGSGRTALLDAVGRDCAGLAPDGVIRLSGYGHHQPAELLHALYSAVYDTDGRRPDRTALLARVREIGAVVLLDDLELGGPALDELLRATPECAYLLAATPDAKAPSDDSHLDEVFLGGLGRTGCTQLLEELLGRPLTEAEAAWAGDLRFASEGLPLRFVQAAALLRRRDELNRAAAGDEDEEPGVFEERPRDPVPVPLPTLAQAAAPAELLASRVSEPARAALRIACALGGELPHPAHLPALVGDTHAEAAVAELLGCGLITPVGPRYRLAEGVARQLEEAGYGGPGAEEARTAARHYAWWTGHASVTPERVAAEADAVLAALAGADVVAAVLLARTAAPAFAASLHWDAWERVLRAGSEAARKAGEVAEQAYFHHELGVLALCEGRLDRARAELEASIGLRGALADKRGTVAGRRALALVTDREALGPHPSPPLRLQAPPLTPGSGGAVAPAPGTPATAAARPSDPDAPVPPVPDASAAPSSGSSFPPVPGASAAPASSFPPVPGASAAPASAFPPVPGASGAPASGSVFPPVPGATVRPPSGAAVPPGPGGSAPAEPGPATPTGPGASVSPLPPKAGEADAALPSGAATTAPLPEVSAPTAPTAKLGKPARPAPGSEAVTQVNPVIRRAQLPPPETPKNLAAVFGNAFPQPAPAPARPVPPRPAGPHAAAAARARKRRTALLGAAGVLTVAALGTVIGLALASGGAAEDPQTPSVTSSPSAPVSPHVPQVPGTGGGDPAADPATPPAPGQPTPQPRPSGTPSRGTTPTATTAPQPPVSSPVPDPPTTPPAPTSPSPVTSPTSASPSPTHSDAVPPTTPTPATAGPQSPTATG
ncbi:ATP-binding protein [Streptomyces sp. NPDC048387]|uniref:ATP-binding protein n=1 Tax=Streptomyces sp. NPDC048387 TaxID=3365542 RepID=UPI0037225933